MKKLLGFLFVMLCTLAHAVEKIPVCAKEELRDGSFSKAYSMVGQLTDGNDLNRRTQSMNYEGYSHYLLLWWKQGQVSIVKMDFPYIGYNSTGVDQEGKKWEITRSYNESGPCF